MTWPLSLTMAVPIATKEPMSWSKEYISVTARGFRLSTFGRVMAAGGLKSAPAGWMVTMNLGC
jgi:hypothetical protein